MQVCSFAGPPKSGSPLATYLDFILPSGPRLLEILSDLAGFWQNSNSLINETILESELRTTTYGFRLRSVGSEVYGMTAVVSHTPSLSRSRYTFFSEDDNLADAYGSDLWSQIAESLACGSGIA
jgi:hypothetical protein